MSKPSWLCLEAVYRRDDGTSALCCFTEPLQHALNQMATTKLSPWSPSPCRPRGRPVNYLALVINSTNRFHGWNSGALQCLLNATNITASNLSSVETLANILIVITCDNVCHGHVRWWLVLLRSTKTKQHERTHTQRPRRVPRDQTVVRTNLLLQRTSHTRRKDHIHLYRRRTATGSHP